MTDPHDVSLEAADLRAQTWSHFLKELQGRGGLPRDLAERAAPSVMCALEQRLFGRDPEQLESRLPVRVRTLLQRCPSHQGMAPREFGRAEFLWMIAKDLELELDEAEHVARVVLETVRERLGEAEVDEVASLLPEDLRTLWRRSI